jgi:hypothetical protein
MSERTEPFKEEAASLITGQRTDFPGSATWYTTHASSTVLTTVVSDLGYYCSDNTRKVCAPVAVRRSEAPHGSKF